MTVVLIGPTASGKAGLPGDEKAGPTNISKNRAPFSGSLYIFWASESALPGEAISVQGAFSDTARVFITVNDGSQAVEIPVFARRVNFLQAMLPGNLPIGLYKLWVQEGNAQTADHFINQAAGHCFNSSEVFAGCSVTIKGRNLFLPGSAPKLRLVAQGSNQSFEATYITGGSGKYLANFKIPTGITAGVHYRAYISNGFGSNAGETALPDDIVAIPPAPDKFKLNLGWSAQFAAISNNVYNIKRDPRLPLHAVGNAVVNDMQAIQDALNRASMDGGGTVYLPAGTYLIKGGAFWGLQIPDNVILKGAGKGLTIIRYGVGSPIAKILGGISKSRIGICDISFHCVDNTGSFGAGLFKGEYIFLSNVQWELKKGDWVEFIESKNIAVIDCDFRQQAHSNGHGPTRIGYCDYVVMRRNNLIFSSAGIVLDKASSCFIENNTLVRDMSFPPTPGNIVHLMVCEFLKDVVCTGNRFLMTNGSIPRNANGMPVTNDGESIISENGGALEPDDDFGRVNLATGSSLTDYSKNWPGSFDMNPVVAIIGGKGMGQVRRIQSRTSNTLNLDQSWDVIPDNTSTYSIFNWGLERVAFLSNEFQGQARGITLYHNPMHRIDIAYNKLVNSGSIDITTIQSNTTRNKFTPVYNIELDSNSVNSSTDAYNGGSIGVQSIQHIMTQTNGTHCINLRMKNNTVTASIPNKPVIQDEPFPSGFNSYLVYHTIGINYQDQQVPGVLGTIMIGNKGVNLANAIQLSTGSYFTSIQNTQLINSPSLIQDMFFIGLPHGSVQTTLH